MKTVIKSLANNRVTVKYECAITGEIQEREFFAPINGGYVRNASGHQVCDGLASTGSTLTWAAKTPLINLIRREYAAMRRAEKSELRRAGF